MARLVWLVFMAALVGTLLAGASFGAAVFGVGDLLGAPPPDMGRRSVTVPLGRRAQPAGSCKGVALCVPSTRIPGAPDVTIYISPTGKVLQAYPADLPDRIKTFHNTGY